MAQELLGSSFALHGGGVDLVFPHHENEVAQSRALGHEFARSWMHNGMLQFVGEKMSKSLGNVRTIRESLDEWGRETVLMLFLGAHWSKPMDYSDETLRAARARTERFRDVFRGESEPAGEGAWDRFAAALDDDFKTPEALAVLHSWRDHELLARALDIFGLGSLAVIADAPADVVRLAEQRSEARSRRAFDEADRLRAAIDAAGWEVRDADGGFQLVPKT
jgi:cysteinyl-tRNA synthetase